MKRSLQNTFRVGAALLLASVVSSGVPARAGAAPAVPVLLELFTSEGCSSCPPADALLEHLDRTQPLHGAQLVVLSEHVDYWDALGWKDPFSSSQFTSRQYDYARKLDPSEGAYTPEIVVDGRAGMVGSDADAVEAAVTHAVAARKLPLMIRGASRDGNRVQLHIDGAAPGSTANLYLALADDSARINVTKGENAGRVLSHVAVVRTLMPLGAVSAQRRVDRDVTVALKDESGAKPVRLVAFLQDEKTGAVLAIASQTL